MDKRAIVALSFLVCLILIVGGLAYWTYGQWTGKKLQGYVQGLEDEGYIIKECSLTEFHVDGVLEVHWFSDFRSIARQENTSCTYIDREIKALYFLSDPLRAEQRQMSFIANKPTTYLNTYTQKMV